MHLLINFRLTLGVILSHFPHFYMTKSLWRLTNLSELMRSGWSQMWTQSTFNAELCLQLLVILRQCLPTCEPQSRVLFFSQLTDKFFPLLIDNLILQKIFS